MNRNDLVVRANAIGLDPADYPNDSRLEQKLLHLEKNVTAITGTLGTQTLTLSGNAANTETVTIGSVTYTWVTALTEAKAAATLTLSGNAANGERVTVEGRTYVFRTALSVPSVEEEVLIGTDAEESIDNLVAAINGAAGEGTLYGQFTTPHRKVDAAKASSSTMTVTAKRVGAYANKYSVSETMGSGAWGSAFLTGGVNSVPNQIVVAGSAAVSLDYLKDAINRTAVDATPGVHYSSATDRHPDVEATTNTATTQVVQARQYAFTNGSIATTETMGNGAWGAAAIAGGVARQNAQPGSASSALHGDKNLNP